MTFTIGPAQRLADGRADSALSWAEIAGKRVFVLRQVGSYADACYDHGRLLAEQVEDGVFPEIIDTIQTGTDVGSDFGDWMLQAIYRRMSDEVFDACSGEFRDGVHALGEGLFEELDDPRFSTQDVRDALVAIDVGNLADGLAHRMEKPLATEVQGTIGYIIRAARQYRRQRSRVSVSREIMGDREGVGRAVQRLRSLSRRVGFGCTAMGAAPGLTQDGRGLHARTFDGAFFAWNDWPGLFLVDERATNPAWHRYVAIGTAGLSYSGGISGMNDAGIACSIHQMSTARYDTGRPGRGYSIAPFLQQRILREAASVAKAETILRTARHFGSWTIVVSDAKVGQAARFEINGGTQTVARADLGDWFSQSNHFLYPGMAERHDHFEDLHYTPTLGKWLESRARLETVADAVGKALDAGTLGTDTAIALLASHADGALGGAMRSFGRTVCKAYGLMGSIARCDPDRVRARDEIWMSIGDAQPGPHAHFAGFAVDWEAMEVTPVAETPMRAPATASADFAASLSDYVDAFATISRPRADNGEYLGRDPTPAEHRAALATALDLLDRACRRAENAGEIDVAFRYARARIAHAAGEYDRAAEDCAFLRHLFTSRGVKLHDWERCLILILSAATGFAQGEIATAQAHLAGGREALGDIRHKLFPDGRPHADIYKWQKVCDALEEEGAGAELPEFDFVTVE